MNMNHLENIIEVAKTGSFSAASQNLHITLSAISQSISTLEEELGITIFTRSRSGAVPTAEGKIIIQKSYEIIEKLQDLRSTSHQFSSTLCGELRLATIPGPMSMLVDTVLGFKKDYPNIQMTITEQGSQEILDDIRHDRLDVGLIIMNDQLEEEASGLVCERLISGRMVVAVSSQSPLALQKSITPEQMLRQSFVLYNDDSVKWFMDQFAADYDPAHILFTSNNKTAIQKAIKDHQAVTVGLDYSFSEEQLYQSGEMVVLQIDMPIHKHFYLGLVRTEGKHFSQATRSFIERLKHEL
ncbi:LysR family transcriptional regulator [Paenibacillus sp. N1-5-1-14]|uniref:LysR family transcriptional regulator n=1 Tax=Paenibacillus radicibacter TaxID=2972488 RepID=UPI002159231F|nr:LysR family transcriptional regulator [Paenibacillus radicibacter]MCR8642531.1 LysR family transcriptional regulator [Paenibacillus radicibacter]